MRNFKFTCKIFILLNKRSQTDYIKLENKDLMFISQCKLVVNTLLFINQLFVFLILFSETKFLLRIYKQKVQVSCIA